MEILDKYSNIKGFIFDLDGTLLDSMSLWQEVDRKYLARFGIAFDPSFSEDIKTMTFNESAKYFIKKFNIQKSEEEIKADWNEMVEIEYRDNIQCKEGVIAFLNDLKSKNIKMCIATSCNKKHAEMALKRLKIEDYFDFIYTSNEAGKNKEHPTIFEHCAIKMNLDKTQCMVVEDLYMALKVAHDANFKTLAIYDDLHQHEINKIKEIADEFIYSFKELL